MRKSKRDEIKDILESEMDVDLDTNKSLESFRKKMHIEEDSEIKMNSPKSPLVILPKKRFQTLAICSLLGVFICGGAIAGGVAIARGNTAHENSGIQIQEETKLFLNENYDNHLPKPLVYLSLNKAFYFSLIEAYKNNEIFYNYEFYSPKKGNKTLMISSEKNEVIENITCKTDLYYSPIDLQPNTLYQITISADQDYSAYFSFC